MTERAERAIARLFRGLLRLYPAAFRDEYERELTLLLVDRLRAAPTVLGRFVACATAFAGVLVNAPREHARLVLQDVAYAKRLLWRDGWFTAVSVTTIALGIGGTCAVFTVAKSLLVDALPYRDADRLAMVWVSNPKQGFEHDFTSYPRLLDWRAQSRLVESFAGFTLQRREMTGAGEPESVRAARVTANFFDVMRARPALGRVFSAEDEQRPAAMLGYGLWQRRFGGSPAVLGRMLTLDGIGHTVVGVLPPRFQFPERDLDVWVSLQPGPSERTGRTGFWLSTVARLRPQASLRQAQAEMEGIARRLAQTHAGDRDLGVRIVGLQRDLTAPLRPTLVMLGAAVSGVLLIACANVAALLLGRGVARRSEVAIRTALGAGRWRVARQLMTEAIVLFGIGGVAGTVLGWLALRWLVALAPPHLEVLQDVSLDRGMILFTISLSLVTGLVFGVVPSWTATRGNVAEVLSGVAKGSSRAALSNRFRTTLVVAQVATAALVLSVAALLVESLVRLQRVDLGFDPRNVLTVRLDLPKARYREFADRARFVEQLLVKVRSLPGIVGSAAGSSVLLGEMPASSNFTIEGRDSDYPLLTSDAVTVDFFRTLKIPLIRGRLFTMDDRANTLRVALINETAARRYWKGTNPIGSRFTYGTAAPDSTWLTVVGVVADTRRAGAEREPFAEAYLPHPQYPLGQGGITLTARIAGPAGPVLAGIRSSVDELDSNLPFAQVAMLDDLLDRRIAAPRFNAWLLSSFAIAAVGLTIVGLYGLLTYLVILRKRELAVRLALGATTGQILRLVALRGLSITGSGAAIGLGAAWLAGGWIRHVLPGVATDEPQLFLLVAAVVALGTLVATATPARHAMRVDPAATLRSE